MENTEKLILVHLIAAAVVVNSSSNKKNPQPNQWICQTTRINSILKIVSEINYQIQIRPQTPSRMWKCSPCFLVSIIVNKWMVQLISWAMNQKRRQADNYSILPTRWLKNITQMLLWIPPQATNLDASIITSLIFSKSIRIRQQTIMHIRSKNRYKITLEGRVSKILNNRIISSYYLRRRYFTRIIWIICVFKIQWD